MPRWLRRSKAERLARRTRSMTLFVPNAARGFIALEDGHIQLRRILIPADHHPSPHAAIVYASRAAAALGLGRGRSDQAFGQVAEIGAIGDEHFERVGFLEQIVAEILGQARQFRVDFTQPGLRILVADDDAGINEVFIWQGDARVLLAMVKLWEDRVNLEFDSSMGVPVAFSVEKPSSSPMRRGVPRPP